MCEQGARACKKNNKKKEHIHIHPHRARAWKKTKEHTPIHAQRERLLKKKGTKIRRISVCTRHTEPSGHLFKTFLLAVLLFLPLFAVAALVLFCLRFRFRAMTTGPAEKNGRNFYKKQLVPSRQKWSNGYDSFDGYIAIFSTFLHINFTLYLYCNHRIRDN